MPTRVGILAAIAYLAIASGDVLQALVDIDDFTSATPQSAQPNNESAATVLGGYRDVKSNNASNTASVDGGRFSCAGTANFQGCTLQYDGQDMNPDDLTVPGLFTPVDLTDGMTLDRIELNTFVDAGSCNLLVQFCDNDATPQCASLSAAAISDGGTETFLFADFTAGLDFSAITAVLINLTPTSTPVDCSVGAFASTPVELLTFQVE